MTSSAKGAARERELVSRFHANNWGALRIGASGSGGDADLPDVLAGRPALGPSTVDEPASLAELWSIELKSGQTTTLYVTDREVEDLRRFADAWGATPLLGARFTHTSGDHYDKTATYLVRPSDARVTDGGAFGLPVADIEERAYAVVSDDKVERR